MASKNDLKYHVDIVFCIDCTESMDNILNIVKSRALHFYDDVQNMMKEKEKSIDRLRVRVVGFRDYLAYDDEKRKNTHCNEPMLVSDFFELPKDASKLEVSVKSLKPIGGGDDEEDGLEALAYAIRSDWDMTPDAKKRHVIVLWTDQAPHKLGTGAKASKYPKGMAKDLKELGAWWGDERVPGFMDQSAKRLIMFAPNEGGWASISDNWNLVVHLPSKAGDHLKDVQYQEILSYIGQTLTL